MLELKPLQPEAISTALDKAKRYRLLNEPDDAESICLDVLATEPGNQQALITLLLTLTDKFGHSEISPAYEQAQELVPKLDSSFSKSYYRGVIFERRAKFHLKQGGPGAGAAAYQWFVRAMEAYSDAITSKDSKNQEAVLRWNSCARILNSRADVIREDADGAEMMLDAFETPH